MSKLAFFARPLVAFDPSNKDHRRYYAEFLEYGGWGKCPVRFVCPEDVGYDLPSMINKALIQYYVDREFGGSKLAIASAQKKLEEADELYKTAGQLRKEAAALKKPRRT
jgi:hypothetical protein